MTTRQGGKIQIEVEATTDRYVQAMGQAAKATDQHKKAVDRNDAALKKARLEYEVAQARAKNYADTQAKTAKKIADFNKVADRQRQVIERSNAAANAQVGKLAKLGRAMEKVNATMQAGRMAFDVLRSGAQTISELAAETTNINNVMGNLPFSIDKARFATGGLVKDMDLAKTASTLMSTGVVSNAKDFAKLARAAQALGGRVGLKAPEAFNSLSAALARGSTEMLDNLGIVLKTEQAHTIYAETLGKTVDALTDTEKAEAFRRVAMDKIIEAAKGIAVDTDSAGAAVQRFEADLDRLKNNALGSVDAQVSLKEALAKVSPEITATAQSIAAHGEEGDKLREALRDVNVETVALLRSNKDLAKELDRVRAEELRGIENQIFAGEVTDENVARLKELRTSLRHVKNSGDAFVDSQIEAQKEQALLARQAQQELEDEHALLKTSIAFLEGKGDEQKLLNETLIAEMELRAKLLEAEGKSAQAAKLRTDIELRRARMEGEALRGRRGRGGKRRGPTEDEIRRDRFVAQAEAAQARFENFQRLNAARAEAQRAAAEARDPFSSENLERQLTNVVDFEERRAEIELNARLRSVEEQRAAGVDPMALLDQETEARLAHLERVRQAEEARLEREILLAEEQGRLSDARMLRAELEISALEHQSQVEDVQHQRAVARIADRQAKERAAHEQKIKLVKLGADTTLQAAGAVARATILEGQALAKSVAGVARSLAFEHSLKAVSELVNAAIAAASYRYGAAAQHTANAAASAAVAATAGGVAAAAGASAGRSSGGASRGAFGAGAFGAGAGTAGQAGQGESSRNADVGGPVPLSQRTRSSVSGEAATGGGGAPVIVQQTIQVSTLGEPDDETMLKLEQAQRRAGRRIGRLATG